MPINCNCQSVTLVKSNQVHLLGRYLTSLSQCSWILKNLEDFRLSSFLYFVHGTSAVFSELISKLIFLHQSSTIFNHCCIRSETVGAYLPMISMIISLACPWVQKFLLFSLTRSSSITISFSRENNAPSFSLQLSTSPEFPQRAQSIFAFWPTCFRSTCHCYCFEKSCVKCSFDVKKRCQSNLDFRMRSLFSTPVVEGLFSRISLIKHVDCYGL